MKLSDLNLYVPESPASGFYTDVENSEYHRANCITKSKLDTAHSSVSLVKHKQDAPEDDTKGDAFDFGSAVHTLVLEPHKFDAEYAVLPDFNLRTNKGKENAETFRASNKHKIIISTEEKRKIDLMVGSVMAHPVASHWLKQDGWAESVVVSDDKQCRPDWLVDAGNFMVCMDLKSTEDMAKFDREFFKYRYHVQDAFYSDIIEAHFGKPCLFFFCVVSKSVNGRIYPVDCVDISPDRRDEGRTIYLEDYRRLREAMDNNDWIEIRRIS